MPSTSLLLVFAVPVLFFALWHMSTTIAPPPIPDCLHQKRIILLIAHPDDESMFFSPAVQALTDPSLGNHVKILCLSTGDADGLGEVRRKELESAAMTLGLRRREDVFVMSDERFRDGMKNIWDEKEIAGTLAMAFAEHLVQATQNKQAALIQKDKYRSVAETDRWSRSRTRTNATSTSTSSKPEASIDVLLTFDSHGISSHPNHISLYHGAKLFLSQLMHGHSGYRCPVDLYTLTTVNLARKYTFIFDLVPTYLIGIYSSIFESLRGQNKGKRSRSDREGDRVVFVSDISAYGKARKAMVHGHKSQMVWFRWGWIGIGRYMVLNDIKRERVIAT